MDYLVAIEPFHGPLDLLLYLVKKHEVDIFDIPIARITEQFLQYLHLIETLDVEAAGDFLVMASSLMEIKSKMLLPRAVTEATTEEEADPRRELVRQLMEYRKLKDAAGLLETQADKHQTRVARDPIEEAPAGASTVLVREVELWDLVSAFGRLIRETAALQAQPIVVDDTPQHVYEQMVQQRLAEAQALEFRELFDPPWYRTRLVGLFLAILELIKQGILWVEQAEPFGTIRLSLRNLNQNPSHEDVS